MPILGKLVSAKLIPSIRWELDVTFFQDKKVGESVLSPKFLSEESKENWQLCIYPKGETNSEDHLSLYLELSNYEKDIDACWYFAFLNENNEQVNAVYYKKRFTTADKNWGILKFIKINDLQDPKNKILKDNKLSIICKVIINENIPIVDEEDAKVKKDADRLKEFDTFEGLFTNKEFSDVIISAGGKNFELHKCILSTRSTVFEAMFRINMKEKNQNIVKIDDVRHEVLEELFQFIYTGKVNNIDEIMGELLTAAEKYCIEGLKKLCEDKISDDIDVDNAIEYLNLAILNNAEKLKEETTECIANTLEIIMLKEEFKTFGKKYPEVLMEIMNKNLSINKFKL